MMTDTQATPAGPFGVDSAGHSYGGHEAAVKQGRPVTRLVNLRVVVDPPMASTYWRRTEEQRIRELEAWARELEEFVRDHRSQDPISLTIERVTETVCDQCSRQWETYTEDGVTYCAGCGVQVGEGIG
jgi:thioesterase domain-containing protein